MVMMQNSLNRMFDEIFQKKDEQGVCLPNGNVSLILDYEDYTLVILNLSDFDKYCKLRGWRVVEPTERNYVMYLTEDFKLVLAEYRSLRYYVWKFFKILF